MRIMKVLYFGAYNPLYSRNAVLIKGLYKGGVNVFECNSRGAGLGKYLSLFLKHWKLRNSYDVMVVGFPGQEVMFLARFLTRKPIVFDAFTSHYGGYILDRKYFSKTGFRAWYYRFMDTWSCRLADVVLLDTQAHIDFFIKEFGLARDKFRRIWVGADTDIFYPVPETAHDNFTVHFHGHFIPLQGVEYIIKTAGILREENIQFRVIGEGQEYGRIRKLAESMSLKNIIWSGNIPYQELRAQMAMTDVCLGIFGDTPKTQLVIPNKVYEALAMKKAVITADTPAVRELLGEDGALLVKTADPEALAKGIMKLKEDIGLRKKIAEGGHRLFITQASTEIIGQQLIQIIKEL